MFWCGDSKFKYISMRWLTNFKYVWKEEIRFGFISNIPICCILWYILTVYLCIIFKGNDVKIMTFMLGNNGYDWFYKNEYYRCPVCRLFNYKSKILWN